MGIMLVFSLVTLLLESAWTCNNHKKRPRERENTDAYYVGLAVLQIKRCTTPWLVIKHGDLSRP